MKKISTLFIALISFSAAQAQSILTVKQNQTTITSSEAGNYDRVIDEWKMEKGRSYLISLPAELDGYYFGPDAKRARVTNYAKKADGTYEVSTTAMDDLDNFLPNEAYIVTPDIVVNSIMHITSGITTEAKATAGGKELLHVDENKITSGIIPAVLGRTPNAEVIYDLQGRKVSSIRNGETYIVNGHKIIIK